MFVLFSFIFIGFHMCSLIFACFAIGWGYAFGGGVMRSYENGYAGGYALPGQAQ